MKSERQQWKLRARDAMHKARPSAKLVTLLYLVISFCISQLVGTLIFQPGDLMTTLAGVYAQGEVDPYYVMQLLAPYGKLLAIGALMTLLVSLFESVLGYGYRSYVVDLARGRKCGPPNLISGFSTVGRVLGASVLVALINAGWMILFDIAAEILIYFIDAIPSDTVYGILVFIIELAALSLTLNRTLRYALTITALADDPELKARDALRRSKELMRGRRMEYVKLILSFFGWYVLFVVVVLAGYFAGVMLMGGALGTSLAGATMADVTVIMGLIADKLWMIFATVLLFAGIYLLFLMPYLNLTLAYFYCDAADGLFGGEAPSGQDPVSPDLPDSRTRPF